MPNSFAVLILLVWPLIGVVIFRMIKDREQAIIATVVWSFLFLPSGVGFDLPGLPPLGKQAIPVLVLLGLLLTNRDPSGNSIVPDRWLVWLVMISYVGGRFLTVMTNPDAIYMADFRIPGLTMHDAVSSLVRSMIFLIPFLIGYGFLYTKTAQFKLLYTLLIGCLIYSVILLIEIRLSPQFHIWVYGFFPHSFLQQVRGDGFRPVGFLSHGLYAAFFVMTCCIAASILMKEQKFARKLREITKIRMHLGLVAAYLFVLLVLCKSLGALILGVCLLPCVLFLSPKMQVRVAALLVTIALAFPILRGNDLFPTETILGMVSTIDERRADSLLVRIKNEDELLARAKERPIFGWGSWGRNRIYSERTGRDISILDGYWVGVIGTAGWVGFLSLFGFLAIPVFLILRRYRGKETANLSPLTSGMCLLVAANMVELLPNSTLFPWTWLMAGALWGHAVKEFRQAEAEDAPRPELQPPRRRTIL